MTQDRDPRSRVTATVTPTTPGREEVADVPGQACVCGGGGIRGPGGTRKHKG
ncbi:MAG: hypothetical protein QF464_02400 [Myxococcota bacterium]|nr:hypothetical protein [Myxococcota bacterium]